MFGKMRSYEQGRDYLQWCWRASVPGGQASWQPQHVWTPPPPATASRLPVCVLAAAFSDGPPPPTTTTTTSTTSTTSTTAATGLFDVRWGWAAALGVEVAFDRLREGHGSGGERGGWLWNDLWHPVNITGPHASQHLICYSANQRTYEQTLQEYLWQRESN